MRCDHIFLIVLFVSPALSLAAIVLLIAALGWPALWVLLGAFTIFVVLSLARDFWQDYHRNKI